MSDTLRNTILICIVFKHFFFLVISHHYTAVDFDDMFKYMYTKRKSEKCLQRATHVV